MKLKIREERIVELVVDLERFKTLFQKDLDLQKAITESMTVEHNPFQVPTYKISAILEDGLNWGRIIDFLPKTTQRQMRVRFCPVEYTDKIQYLPGAIGTDQLSFVEQRGDGEDIILIQDLFPNVNSALKNYINQTTYQFTQSPTWGLLVEMRKPVQVPAAYQRGNRAQQKRD